MIKTLEQLQKDIQTLRILQKKKETLYYPVHSPHSETGVRNASRSDPTAGALRKIEKVDNQITDCLVRIADELSIIETWLETVEDGHIRAAIRWHYLIGLNWSETCKRVYGYRNYHTARSAVYRYLGLKN